jgi:hypothetical protein
MDAVPGSAAIRGQNRLSRAPIGGECALPDNQFIAAQFLPGRSLAEGVVRIEYLSVENTRSELTFPLLEAMLLLVRLETIRVEAHIELPTDRRQ